jgi:GNAT superfamily N-acetyltransferase
MLSANIVVLPISCDDADSWERLFEKSKAFRLDALRDDPEAFSSTFAEWQAFPREHWIARMTNPRATTIISLASPPSESTSELQNILDSDWLASSVLVRPEDQDESHHSANKSPWSSTGATSNEASSQSKEANRNILFLVNGVYVKPGARGLGVGTAHLNGSIEAGNAIARAEGVSKVNYQVRVVSTNTSAIKLYERVGFKKNDRKETVQMKEKVKDGVVIPAQEACILAMDRVDTLKS